MKVNREFLRRNEENYPEIVPENRDFIRFFMHALAFFLLQIEI